MPLAELEVDRNQGQFVEKFVPFFPQGLYNGALHPIL
jgi:hypothetical protein